MSEEAIKLHQEVATSNPATTEQQKFVEEFRWRWDYAIGGRVACPDDTQLIRWSKIAGFDGPVLEETLARFARRLEAPASKVHNPVKFFTGILSKIRKEWREAA